MANAKPDTSGLVPGRKSLSGDGIHSPRITIRLPAAQKAALDERAAARGVSSGALAREIIVDGLASSQ